MLSHVGMTLAQLQTDTELAKYRRSYSHHAFYWWILSRGLAFIVIKLGSERITDDLFADIYVGPQIHVGPQSQVTWRRVTFVDEGFLYNVTCTHKIVKGARELLGVGLKIEISIFKIN